MHQRHAYPTVPAPKCLIIPFLIGALLIALTGGPTGQLAVAAPDRASVSQSRDQNVDYLGPSSAARLSLDFPVFVPSYVPGPFSGEPAVDAGGGFYSLYWMIPGAPPTFLQVTGQVGGTLPAGSPYDLNVQLSVNATVQGYDAIHDVTPAYDAVWWIAGGVLYSVESLNMATDSLSLANSLIPFVAPEAQEPDIEAPVEELPPDAGGGVLETPTNVPELPGEATDPGVDNAEEPVAASEATEEPADNDAVVPAVTAEASLEATTVAESAPTSAAEPESTAETESTAVATGEPVEEPGDGETSGGDVGSDGTGGAPLPIFGGDGTGGTMDLVVPDPDE